MTAKAKTDRHSCSLVHYQGTARHEIGHLRPSDFPPTRQRPPTPVAVSSSPPPTARVWVSLCAFTPVDPSIFMSKAELAAPSALTFTPASRRVRGGVARDPPVTPCVHPNLIYARRHPGRNTLERWFCDTMQSQVQYIDLQLPPTAYGNFLLYEVYTSIQVV